MELHEFISEFTTKRRSVPTDREFLQVYPEMEQKTIDMYYQVFKVKIKITCTTCIMDYFFELKSLTKPQIENLMKLNFKLKDNVLVEVDNNHYTSRSKKMTPEIGTKIFNKYGMRVFDYYHPEEKPKEPKEEFKKPEEKPEEKHFEQKPRGVRERPPQTVKERQHVIKKAGKKKTKK